jgi:hypothetical protein
LTATSNEFVNSILLLGTIQHLLAVLVDLGIDVVDIQRVQSFMNLLINSFKFAHLVEKFTGRKSSCVELLLVVYKIAVHGNPSIHLKEQWRCEYLLLLTVSM